MGIIEETIDAIALKDLETIEESEKKDKKPKKVELTAELVLQVVELARAGVDMRDIKRSVIDAGPQGQKWKLDYAQIREILEYRAKRYAELTVDTIEP